ncbi:polysaccharide deacetylase family protein [Actinomadura sp. DC4]|uniref:polysaccharide deacetylase family protein n=1 Tax=Actinomadura sp. DC4 TaxID=3055069 RepID=UPI0025B02D8A|nr:polysaccharide deacetylase family protein [Actinomadura sp. DC4]MDN3357717.1 polysaccharide deacetylase family protein [Actinomadura sp. DC4]
MKSQWIRRRAATALLAAGALVAAFAGSATGAARGPGGDDAAMPQNGTVTEALAGSAAAQRSADRTRREDPQPRSQIVPVRPHKATGSARPAVSTKPSALVLYDTSGPYGFLGELYAMLAANLAGHFGTVKTEPVSSYTAGQVERYTATVYIGSTYYGGDVPDAIPDAFYGDVATTAKPVVWMNDNIWNFAGEIGVPAFEAKYGWDPTTSYFGPAGQVAQVDYKSEPLTRTVPPAADGGVLRPNIVTGTGLPAVTTLAQAEDTSTSPATAFPWAIRSGNLTYLGEIPFSYVNESDRLIAFEDLLFDALAPTTPTRHRALLRLEDISPDSDATELMAVATYLHAQHIPYGFEVIPVYTDPNGAQNDGVPRTRTLAQVPRVLTALRYMLSHGGTIIEHGYTHQYRNVANPYDGVSANDFEFFRSHIDGGDNVVLDGPVPEDSALWATGRVVAGKAAFPLVGLPVPALWTTPHYAASAVDYGVFKNNYTARYERSLYYAGQLSGQPIDSQRYVGQFFPYVVHDVYGTTVLPEDLGNYGPEAYNNHPPRLPADIVRSAKLNLAVRDGFASFFYHPYYPVAPLQEIVEGIRDLGYTFVSPASVLP